MSAFVRHLAAVALLVASGGGFAQGRALSVDPTRPPGANAQSAGEGEMAAGPRLQSVLIAPNRRLAVINGEMVPLGGKVGEAKVVAIRETEVVLRAGDQTEVLRLTPAAEKKPVRRRATAPAAGRTSKERG